MSSPSPSPSPSNSGNPIRIGIVCQPKKRKQFFEPFLTYVNANSNGQIQCHFIDYLSEQQAIVQHHRSSGGNDNDDNSDIEQQIIKDIEEHLSNEESELLRTDILFLKVTDDMNIEHVSEQARRRLMKIEKFIEMRRRKQQRDIMPNNDAGMLVIEELSHVRRLLDRVEMYSFLQQKLGGSGNNSSSTSTSSSTDGEKSVVHVPSISILDEGVRGDIEKVRQQLERDGVQFPIVCKTAAACGELITHNMAMVFNERQLMDEVLNSEQQEIPLPIVAQQYINHDGVMYKAYVIGEQVFVQEKKSIRNLYVDRETKVIRFNSQYPFPEELLVSSSVPSVHDNNSASVRESLLDTNSQLFHDITQTLSDALNIQLFGFDLIREVDTGRFFCVDANFLPSYSTVPDVHHKMMHHILQRYEKHLEQQHRLITQPQE